MAKGAEKMEQDKAEQKNYLQSEGLRLLDKRDAILRGNGYDEKDQSIVDIDAEMETLKKRWRARPGIQCTFERGIRLYAAELKKEKEAAGEAGTDKISYFIGEEELPGKPGEKRAVLREDVNQYFIESANVTETCEDLVTHAPPLDPYDLIDGTDREKQIMAIKTVFRPFPQLTSSLLAHTSLPKGDPNHDDSIKFLTRIYEILKQNYEKQKELQKLQEDVETEQLVEGAESKFKNLAEEVRKNPGKALLLTGGLVLSLTLAYKWGGDWTKKWMKRAGIAGAVGGGLVATAFGADFVMKAISDDNTGLFDALGFNPGTMTESAALSRFSNLFKEMDELNDQAARDLIRLGNTPISQVLSEYDSAHTSGKESINPRVFYQSGGIKKAKTMRAMNGKATYQAVQGVVLEAAKRAGKPNNEQAGIAYLRTEFGPNFTVFMVLMHLNNQGTLQNLSPDGTSASAFSEVYGIPSSPEEAGHASEVRAMFGKFASIEDTDIALGGGIMLINGYPFDYEYEWDSRQGKATHILKEGIGTDKKTFKLQLNSGTEELAKSIVRWTDKRMKERFIADTDLQVGYTGPKEIEYSHDKHQWVLKAPIEFRSYGEIGSLPADGNTRYVDLSIFPDEDTSRLHLRYKGKEYPSFAELRLEAMKDSVKRKVQQDLGFVLGDEKDGLAFSVEKVTLNTIHIKYDSNKEGRIFYAKGRVSGYTLQPSDALDQLWKDKAQAQAMSLLNAKGTLDVMVSLEAAWQGGKGADLTTIDGWKQYYDRISERLSGPNPVNMSYERKWLDAVRYQAGELEIIAKHGWINFYDRCAGATPPTKAEFDAELASGGKGIVGTFEGKLGSLRSKAREISAKLNSGTIDTAHKDKMSDSEGKALCERNWKSSTYKGLRGFVDTAMNNYDVIGQKNLSKARATQDAIRLDLFDLSYPLALVDESNPAALAAFNLQYPNWTGWVAEVKATLPNILATAEVDDQGNFLFVDRRYDVASFKKALAGQGIVSLREYTGAAAALGVTPTLAAGASALTMEAAEIQTYQEAKEKQIADEYDKIIKRVVGYTVWDDAKDYGEGRFVEYVGILREKRTEQVRGAVNNEKLAHRASGATPLTEADLDGVIGPIILAVEDDVLAFAATNVTDGFTELSLDLLDSSAAAEWMSLTQAVGVFFGHEYPSKHPSFLINPGAFKGIMQTYVRNIDYGKSISAAAGATPQEYTDYFLWETVERILKPNPSNDWDTIAHEVKNTIMTYDQWASTTPLEKHSKLADFNPALQSQKIEVQTRKALIDQYKKRYKNVANLTTWLGAGNRDTQNVLDKSIDKRVNDADSRSTDIDSLEKRLIYFEIILAAEKSIYDEIQLREIDLDSLGSGQDIVDKIVTPAMNTAFGGSGDIPKLPVRATIMTQIPAYRDALKTNLDSLIQQDQEEKGFLDWFSDADRDDLFKLISPDIFADSMNIVDVAAWETTYRASVISRLSKVRDASLDASTGTLDKAKYKQNMDDFKAFVTAEKGTFWEPLAKSGKSRASDPSWFNTGGALVVKANKAIDTAFNTHYVSSTVSPRTTAGYTAALVVSVNSFGL